MQSHPTPPRRGLTLPAPPPDPAPRDRTAALLVLAIVATYATSLGGGFVWDDWIQVADNPALADPLQLLLGDIRVGGEEGGTDHYRPLVMITHAPLQALLPGPLGERMFNLSLHVLAAFLVREISQRLGASALAATLGAALFAVHTGAVEAVAWISGRHDLLPAVLFLGAWASFLRARWASAGLLLALTPFCKESYLLAPLCALVWMLGERRLVWRTLGPAALGVGLYVSLRQLLDLPMPVGGFIAELPAGLGAMAARGLSLAAMPWLADPLPVFRGAPVLGWLALGLGAVLLPLAWGRPALAGLLAAVALLAPAAQASQQLGLVADRYLYVFLAALAASATGALSSKLEARPVQALGWVLVLLMVRLSGAWAAQWRTDADLFEAAHARHPDSPHAAFHLAHELHTRQDNCAAAIPLYRQGRSADPRAGNNLQACLVALGQLEEAAALGPELTEASPDNPNPAANTARALVALGRQAEAEAWAEEATERAPERCALHILLGNIRGQLGEFDQAESAFHAAGETGCVEEARRGLEAVTRARSARTP